MEGHSLASKEETDQLEQFMDADQPDQNQELADFAGIPADVTEGEVQDTVNYMQKIVDHLNTTDEKLN